MLSAPFPAADSLSGPSNRGRHAVPLLAAALTLALSACSRTESVPEPVRAVRTQVVTARAVANDVEYAGEVKARIESRLSFRVGGKLTRRAVELGQPVKAGQLLAQLDPTDLQLGQEAARASLAAAQANFVQTEANYKRYVDLRAQGFISAVELEQRETALKAARSALDQAKAQSGVQTNQAAYSRLVADVAGVVTSIDAEPGMVVAAGTPVVRIAQDGSRDVVFNVPEDRVAGMRTLIGREGALKVKLWGQATPISASLRELAAAADPTTRTFLAKADIGRADVRLGQTANVVVAAVPVAAAGASGASSGPAAGIPVPMAALAEHGGRSQVWVLDPSRMTVAPQVVEVVGTDGQQAFLGSGLKPGQEIVIAGVHVLSPNQTVKRYQGGMSTSIVPVVPSASAPTADLASTPASAAR